MRTMRARELRSIERSVPRAASGIFEKRALGHAGRWPRLSAVRWWGRVEAARMKRVALTHAPGRKQAAPPEPVHLQARHCVARARGLEPAHPTEEPRKRLLIKPQ